MRILTPALLFLICASAAGAKSYDAERYDALLNLDSQGILTVTETAVFHFVDGPFTFVFREIADTETDGIEGVQAWIDGQPCEHGTGPSEVEIQGASPVVVRWHFAPIVNGSRMFTVRYRVRGTVRTAADSQSLVWRALPPKRSYPIETSHIVLEYPPAIAPRTVELRAGGPAFELNPGRAEVELINSPAGADVVVRARFPAGSFAGPAPGWLHEQEEMSRAQEQGARLGGIAAAIFLTLTLIWALRTRLPAHRVSNGYGTTVVSPPDPLAPAIAATLIGKGPASLGTLLDLAQRGVLHIEAARGLWGAHSFQVIRQEENPALAPHEAVLMGLAFRTGETKISLESFFSRQMRGFAKGLRNELERAGMVDEARAQARRKLLIAGGLGFAAAIALIALGAVGEASGKLPMAGVVALILGVSAVVAALLALILGAAQSIWSQTGMVESGQWKAYAAHLAMVAGGRAPLPEPDALEKLLPYAASFGLMSPLLKLEAKQRGIALPIWFRALQTATSSDASSSFLAFSHACNSSSSSGAGGGGGGGGGGRRAAGPAGQDKRE